MKVPKRLKLATLTQDLCQNITTPEIHVMISEITDQNEDVKLVREVSRKCAAFTQFLHFMTTLETRLLARCTRITPVNLYKTIAAIVRTYK